MGRPPGSKNKKTLKKEARKRTEESKMICFSCEDLKREDEFYTSSSDFWRFSKHKVPICKSCIKTEFDKAASKFGKKNAMIMVCALLNLPFLPIPFQTLREKDENFTVGKYICILNTKKWKNMTFVDSIIDGDVFKTDEEIKVQFEQKWPISDARNMNSVISRIGYDPFTNMLQDDRKEGFSILSRYLDVDGVSNDVHKTQIALHLTQSHLQLKKTDDLISELVNKESVSESRLKDLEASRKSILESLNRTAKDNNFSSQYDSAEKNCFTNKMMELQKNNFEAIKVNMFDVKTSEAMRQIADLSNQSIMAYLDENDCNEIIKDQRQMIADMEKKILEVEEELRLAKNTLIAANKKKGT
ncbi:MAG: hypothetical protein RR370_01785 [Synergistaceae bacterium]